MKKLTLILNNDTNKIDIYSGNIQQITDDFGELTYDKPSIKHFNLETPKTLDNNDFLTLFQEPIVIEYSQEESDSFINHFKYRVIKELKTKIEGVEKIIKSPTLKMELENILSFEAYEEPDSLLTPKDFLNNLKNELIEIENKDFSKDKSSMILFVRDLFQNHINNYHKKNNHNIKDLILNNFHININYDTNEITIFNSTNQPISPLTFDIETFKNAVLTPNKTFETKQYSREINFNMRESDIDKVMGIKPSPTLNITGDDYYYISFDSEDFSRLTEELGIYSEQNGQEVISSPKI